MFYVWLVLLSIPFLIYAFLFGKLENVQRILGYIHQQHDTKFMDSQKKEFQRILQTFNFASFDDVRSMDCKAFSLRVVDDWGDYKDIEVGVMNNPLPDKILVYSCLLTKKLEMEDFDCFYMKRAKWLERNQSS